MPRNTFSTHMGRRGEKKKKKGKKKKTKKKRKNTTKHPPFLLDVPHTLQFDPEHVENFDPIASPSR
jgi:hypothetical protein